MDIYKQANRLGLRFNTNRGLLATEQLFQLSLADLDALAVSLEVSQTGKKSFIRETSVGDEIAKLKFDVALDVLNTIMKEQKDARESLDNKRKNEKILALIAEKQDGALKEKTVEELEAMLIITE
jgi:hypothetical protein